ncbi:MAG: AraC family ligand binding domain-containing protein, partial [Flavitalea sp.]
MIGKLFNETILHGDHLFVLKEERFPFNEFPLHIHPEYELILVLKSSGKRYVGDSIDSFLPGDLCLFGPDLPHTFYNKHLPGDREVHQVVIQFRGDFLGESFFERPQFAAINGLFKRSGQGICFRGGIRDLAANAMQKMLQADEAEAIASLISLLNQLARSQEYELLCSYNGTPSAIYTDTERMSKVYHFLLDNFKREISLEEISSVANLSPPAFCRYFKKHTRKTQSEFLNELRINYACQLLQQNKSSVLEISLDSG